MSKKVGRHSQSANDFLEPKPVENLTATDVGTNRAFNDGAVDLTWSLPVGSPEATSYTIKVWLASDPSAPTPGFSTSVSPSSVSPAVSPGVSPAVSPGVSPVGVSPVGVSPVGVSPVGVSPSVSPSVVGYYCTALQASFDICVAYSCISTGEGAGCYG